MQYTKLKLLDFYFLFGLFDDLDNILYKKT